MSTEDSARTNHLERCANSKIGELPEGFEWRRVEHMPYGATILQGGVCRVVKRGKHKGHTTCDRYTHTTTVSDSELAAEIRRWEAETGKCGDCYGDGRTLKSLSVAEGKTYRQCATCGGTGEAAKR